MKQVHWNDWITETNEEERALYDAVMELRGVASLTRAVAADTIERESVFMALTVLADRQSDIANRVEMALVDTCGKREAAARREASEKEEIPY